MINPSNGRERPSPEGNGAAENEKTVFSAEERLLEKKIRAAQRTLGFESFWPRIWLPIGVCGVFVLLSAFEVWQLLPPRVHAGLLLGFGGALFVSLIPILLWRRPTREEALSRLERASALDHRPLTAYRDTLTQTDDSPETTALWRAHRSRMAALLQKLKAGAPHPRVDIHDPFALRVALLLMLAVVCAWQWTDLGSRLIAAFKVPEIPPSSDFRLDAWITPPPYTRKEPIILANGSLPETSAKDAVAVPQGSVLTVKINGADAHRYAVSVDAQAMAASGQSGETFTEYTQKIEHPGKFAIKRNYGSERSWILTVIPDRAPAIAFAGPIEVSQRGTMLLKYKVDDDYGVISAEAHIERVNPDGAGTDDPLKTQLPIGKPPVFALSLPRAPVKSGEAKTYKDLASHPWAGLPVVATLIAKDEAGQEGRSAPRGFILPERKFTKPLAKAIVEQRRSLVENPARSPVIAKSLDALALSAEDDNIEPSIYLSLRSAYWRLRGDTSIDQLESVVEQLWNVAVRIEDGNLPEAERELRAAQERLKEALEKGASSEEIQKRMDELRQALNRYLQAMASRNDKSDKSAPASPDTKTVTAQELQQLLNKIENLAKAGSTEAAAQMLNELRDILESLQTAKKGGSGSDEMDSESMQQLDKLTNLMRQQQQLLDQTFRSQQESDENAASENSERGQRGARGERGQGGRKQQGSGQGQPRTGDLQKRQGDIQQQLQELLSQMSPGKDGQSIQQKLQEAEKAMGQAGNALGEGDLGEASDQESQALDRLRQGTRAMAEQMMRSAGGGKGGSQAGRDPLGRKQNGQLSDPGDSVKVPDEITVQRAREILDELRKRLGQPTRPAIELDYLERLVKPF